VVVRHTEHDAASGEAVGSEWWRIRLPGGTPEKLDVAIDPAYATTVGSAAGRASPDGTHIAFVRRVAPGPNEIWRLDNVAPDSRAR
jgi:hypothetical protein